MTRQEAKGLQEAFNHFANGGNLWCYASGEWIKQGELLLYQEYANIIEDRHFEARKAFALGEEIERKNTLEDGTIIWETLPNEGECCNYPFGEYRPKPKEPVYEWQWSAYTHFRDSMHWHLTDDHYTEAPDDKHGWTKFEPSKRIKNDNL